MDEPTKQRDWRSDYLVCEHVADGTAKFTGIRHRGYRVCCAECFQITDEGGMSKMLYVHLDDIVTEKRGELVVYWLVDSETVLKRRADRETEFANARALADAHAYSSYELAPLGEEDAADDGEEVDRG